MNYNIEQRRQRSRRRPWTNRTWVLCLLLIIFFFSAKAAWGVYQDKIKSEKQAELKEKELATLENRENYLKGEVKKLSTPEGKEEELRDKFGVVRPGENVAIIVDTQSATTTSSGSGIFSSIKNFFENLFK